MNNIKTFNDYIKENVSELLSGKSMDEFFKKPKINILQYFQEYDDGKYTEDQIYDILSKVPQIKKINSLYNEIMSLYDKSNFKIVYEPNLEKEYAEYTFYLEFFTDERIRIGIKYDSDMPEIENSYFLDDFKRYYDFDTYSKLKNTTLKVIKRNIDD
jgi:hypothetical protein